MQKSTRPKSTAVKPQPSWRASTRNSPTSDRRSPGDTQVQPNPVLSQLQQQLAQAKVQLQVAEQQYTDQHPTVIGLKRQQAELQHEIAQTPATVVAQANTMPNPVFVQFNQQAAVSRAQVASDYAQLAQLNRQRGPDAAATRIVAGKSDEPAGSAA